MIKKLWLFITVYWKLLESSHYLFCLGLFIQNVEKVTLTSHLVSSQFFLKTLKTIKKYLLVISNVEGPTICWFFIYFIYIFLKLNLTLHQKCNQLLLYTSTY